MLRVTGRLAAVILLLLILLPLHGLTRLAGRASPWPRRFLGRAGRIAGARTRILGSPATAPVLYVANHLSWLDILVMARATGAAFVSKAELSRWPIVGALSKLNHTIFVERAERGAVRGQADVIRDALAGGRPVALFPEGTTGDGKTVLPFRASLLAALYPPIPGLKVQPVAIDYGAATEEVAWTEESTVANVLRILSRPGAMIATLRFLKPIDPGEAGDRKALASLARERIVEALGASARGADRL